MDTEIWEYSWEGSFEYLFDQEGYEWVYPKQSDWRIGKVFVTDYKKTPNELYKPSKPEEKCLPVDSGMLKNRALKICEAWEDLQKHTPDPDSSEKPTLLEWLVDEQPSLEVGSAVSVMLNNIANTGLIKPFRILSTFIKDHLIFQCQGLPNGHPCWFYLAQPYPFLAEFALVFPGWFFETDQEWAIKSNDSGKAVLLEDEALKQRFEFISGYRVLHRYSLLNYELNYEPADRRPEKLRITLRDSVSIAPYRKGRVCNCIPIPGEAKRKAGREPLSVLTPEVVVSSPRVAEALPRLNRIWEDRFAQSVLISAPPGSGKEALARSIPYGCNRQTENFMSISLAAGNQRSLEEQLYGRRTEDGSIQEGLISKAAKSAILLDEVHYPPDKPGIRASLLRPLEAREYIPVGAADPQEIEDVLFILITSKGISSKGTKRNKKKGETLDRVPPEDFWTRMNHTLRIEHPLDLKDLKQLKKVLESFYKFFWWERVENFFDVDPVFLLEKSEHPSTLLDFQKIATLLRNEKLEESAKKFTEALCRAKKKNRLNGLKSAFAGFAVWYPDYSQSP